jgi:hypothetical protein
LINKVPVFFGEDLPNFYSIKADTAGFGQYLTLFQLLEWKVVFKYCSKIQSNMEKTGTATNFPSYHADSDAVPDLGLHGAASFRPILI